MDLEFPFIDFPAAKGLTIRLECRGGHVHLFMYWGGDPAHDLGTSGRFWWDGSWRDSEGVPPPSKILGFMYRKLELNDFSSRTVSEFRESEVPGSVVRDVHLHSLTLQVMGS